MSSTIAIVFVLSGLAASGTIAILSLRLSGVRSDRDEARRRLHESDRQLQETAREFAQYKARALEQFSALRKDIEGLENDLSRCDTPGARRARLERLLSKATPRDGGSSPAIVSIGSRGAPGGSGGA